MLIKFCSNNPHKSCWCPFGAMDSILPKSALQRIHSGCNPRLWQFELSNVRFPNLCHQLIILKITCPQDLMKNRRALQKQSPHTKSKGKLKPCKLHPYSISCWKWIQYCQICKGQRPTLCGPKIVADSTCLYPT